MSLMQSAKEILLKRRQQAQQNAFSAYQKAMSNAELKACQQEIDRLLPEIAKSEALGKADEKLNKKYSDAINLKKELLQKYNIDEKGEEVCYLIGGIVRTMFRVFSKIICS